MNREQQAQDRLHAHVGRFLDSIKGDSWKGTPAELAAAINDFGTWGDYPISKPAAMLGPITPAIEARGWVMTSGKSNGVRFVKFERKTKGRKPK